MKFSSTIVALLLSALVTSERLSFFGGQRVLDESLRVPGESPLEFCQPNHDDDLLVIDHVNLLPNPPAAYVLYPDTHRYAREQRLT
jgi:hypothetical protein